MEAENEQYTDAVVKSVNRAGLEREKYRLHTALIENGEIER